MNDESVKQLKQALDLAKRQLQDLDRYADAARDECTECNDCFAQGVEAASEPFEDFVDEIQKILKQHDIDSVLNSNPAVSDKQLMFQLIREGLG